MIYMSFTSGVKVRMPVALAGILGGLVFFYVPFETSHCDTLWSLYAHLYDLPDMNQLHGSRRDIAQLAQWLQTALTHDSTNHACMLLNRRTKGLYQMRQRAWKQPLPNRVNKWDKSNG